ncbi:unnamed protein product [Brachionus calyciflorus]|uniref:Uncharacterized protein n=1 Tax=Brachionus calyciflorus TaxID=104777 RepID=A0A814IV74_9BILA|nr:unnamed protein product [Brachionus calyciflorus]
MKKSVSKNQIYHDIIKYYQDLINAIDTHAEKILADDLVLNDEKININNNRIFIISKINELEQINLKCLKFEPFCFFIEKEFENDKKNRTIPMFGIRNGLGKLIILKNQIEEDLIQKIKNFIFENESPDKYYYDSFKDYLKFHITLKLIDAQCSNLIIDLSNPEFNILKIIKFFDYTKRFKRIRLKNLKCLGSLINLKAVENLTTVISGMYPFPDYLGLFQYLKNLEIYDSNWEILPSNGFSSLKLLENLTLYKTEIRLIEKDAFKGLKNLKRLIIRIGNTKTLENNMFNDLVNLQELSFDEFEITSIKLNTFIDLKKLETLFVSHNTIEQMELSGLTSLRYLYLMGRRNKLLLDSNFFNNCFNLTVINLEDFYINDLPSNIFESLKCLKYLNISNRKLFLSDNIILKSFDFLKPLKYLEYLSVTLNEDLYQYFNLIELPILKYLCIKCYNVPILKNNFKNLITLQMEFIKKIEPLCFNNLNGIRNLKLIFDDNRNLGYIYSTYFNTLDNLDYLFFKSINYLGEHLNLSAGECFVQLFDRKKRLNKSIKGQIEIKNEDAEIDICFGLSDETKNAIEISNLALEPLDWTFF